MWRTKRVFCIMNTVYFAQRTGLFTENKVFETGLAIRGQVLSKLRNERSLDHLGRQVGGRAHTGALSCAALPFKRSCGGGQQSLTQLEERRRWQAAWEDTDPPGEHRPGSRLTGTHTQSGSGQPSAPRTSGRAGSGEARWSARTQGVPG